MLLPLVNRTAQALSAWLGAAFEEKYAPGGLPARPLGSRLAGQQVIAEREQLGAKARMLELRPDLDQVEGLSSEQRMRPARQTNTATKLNQRSAEWL